MKFDIKKLNVFYGPETQNIWNMVDIEKKENRDQLKFNKDYDNFLTAPDEKMSFAQKLNIENKVKYTLWNINEKMEWLMDFGLTDGWEVDIDDWHDTQYLKEVAWEINNAAKDYISWQWKAKNTLNANMDSFITKLSTIEEKATSAENLKWFLNKLEDNKRETTLNKVASHIHWIDNIWNNNSERISDSV